MDPSSSDRNPVDELAEEFVERYRRGERPSLQEYTDRYPQWAEKIRALFPALVMMEQVRPVTAEGGHARPRETSLTRLGDYRILREVGRGGMGIVYEAEQESLNRHVALKVLVTHAVLDPRHLERFRREARAAARLHHTNIVPVHGVGEQDGLHYYVMQFIQGLGLHEVLTELKRLRQARQKLAPPPATKQGLAATVAEALLDGQFAPSLEGDRRQGTGVSQADPLTPDPSPLTPPGGAASHGMASQPRASALPQEDEAAQSRRSGSSSAVHLPGQAEGASLSESGWAYWRSVARIGLQVAEALAHAHSQGILHRDIKPSNLLLDTHGTVWITDFGLAKTAEDADNLTYSGDVVGTLRYLAPERFQGTADVRSDVYALGLTLYELLTLRPAFDEAERNQLIAQVMHDQPVRPRKLDPAVPRDLETIVLKAIAREPAQRYQTATELADDLQRFLDDRPIKARRLSVVQRGWRWCRRKPVVAALLALLLVTIGCGFAGVLWQAQRAEREKAIAQQERDEADKNFRQVLQTIDRYCTQISEDVLLDEPGMQPLRRRLLTAAQEYYRQFVRQGSDKPQVRVELGGACQRLGRLTGDLESWSEALPYFQDAVAIFDQLTRDYPEVPDYRHRLALACNDVGSWYLLGPRLDEAGAAFHRALELEEVLAANHPGEAAYRDQRAIIQQNLGRLYEEQRQTTQARAAYETARELWRELHEQDARNARYRERLGSANHDLGRLLHKTGPMEQAEAFYQNALTLREPLAAERPDVIHYQEAVAASHVGLGQLYYDMKQLSEAESAYKKGATVWADLVAHNPRVMRFEAEQAHVYNKLGAVQWRAGQATAALETHQKALAMRQRRADDDPKDATRQRDLAESYVNVSLAYKDLRKSAEAEAANRRAIPIFERLVHDYPTLPDYRYRLALAYNNLGTVFRSSRRWKDAEEAFRAAAPHWEELARDHPSVVDYARFQAAIYYNLGLTYQDTDRIDEAEQAFRQALEINEKLSHEHPAMIDFGMLVGKTYGRLGDMQRDHGKPEAALEWFERGQTKLEEVLKMDGRRVDTREGLRNIHWGRAMALGDLDRHAEAVRDWERALALDAGNYHGEIRLKRATALASLGQYTAAVAEGDAVLTAKPKTANLLYQAGLVHAAAAGAVAADKKVSSIEREELHERYSARCVALLTEAQTAGYFKDPANGSQFQKSRMLQPLRSRPDFQALLHLLNEKTKPPGSK
jgi:serine/threonine-protein kinase